jgi:hypothetical protein
LEEIEKTRQEKADEKRKHLLNETINIDKTRRMFESEERTNHKDIPPAKYRI